MSTDQKFSLPPPLGVKHLLVLTGCVAFALAIQVRSLELMSNTFSSQTLPAFQIVFLVGSSFLSGLALAGMFWLFDWRRRLGPFSLQPGHWLIISSGVAMLVTSATQLVLFSSVGFEWPGNNAWLRTLPAIFQFAGSVVVLGLACARTSGLWRYLMVALLLRSTCDSMLIILVLNGSGWSYLMGLYNAAAVSQVLPIVFLIAAVMWDLTRKHRRDWMHYCGVVFLVALLSAQVASMIYYRFFFNP